MSGGTLRQDLNAAESLPYGVARTSATERVVELADDAGDEDLAWEARVALIGAYTFGGEPLKEFAPFAWLLRRYDENPAAVSADARFDLLWRFKWLTDDSLRHPGISAAQIEQGLADMEQRYREAAEGLAPYLYSRYEVTVRMHGHEAAHESYLAWTRAPRTHLSDLPSSESMSRGEHLAALGRYADAVRELDVAVSHDHHEEEHRTAIGLVLEPLLLVGDPGRAVSEHLRGVRLMRAAPHSIWGWDRHILVLARTGRLMRGLDLLEESLVKVDAPPTPADGMWLAAAGARLLRGLDEAGFGDLPVAGRAAPQSARGDRTGAGRTAEETVTALAERLTDVARGWARQFDARNGTPVVGSEVEKWLDAAPLPDLPLDHVSTSRDGLRRRGGGSACPSAAGFGTGGRRGDGRGVGAWSAGGADRPGVAVPAAAPAHPQRWVEEFAEVSAVFEDSRTSGHAASHRTALERWRVLRAAPDRPSDEDGIMVARLDAALAVDEAVDGAGPVDAVHAAAEALREHGEHARAGSLDLIALQLELRGAADGPMPATDLLARVDAITARVERDGTPVQAAALQRHVVGVLFAAADHGELEGTVVAERAASAARRAEDVLDRVSPEDLSRAERAHLAMLLRLGARTGEPDRARVADLLQRAWGLLPSGVRVAERAVLGLDLAIVLGDTDRAVQALDVLAEVVVDAERAEEPTVAARALALSGSLRGWEDDTAAAATVADLGAAARLFAEHGDSEELAAGRRDQVYALRAAGRGLDAAEVAENAVLAWERHLAAQGVEVDGDLPADRAEPAAAAHGGRLAGMLAFAAAVSCADLGETARALRHAERSADWHRLAGWGVAEAESRGLCGDLDDDPARTFAAYARSAQLYDEAGEWALAARGRRGAAMAALHADGLPAALLVLAEASGALDDREPGEGEQAALARERLALTGQHATVLARGGRPEGALTLLDGLVDGYREAGDLRAVTGVAHLRARCLDDLGRAEEALPELTALAEETLAAGLGDLAHDLGNHLAVLLEDLGRLEEAEQVWDRFSPG